MSTDPNSDSRAAWDAYCEATKQPPIEGPRGSIQWKGTNVCMDVWCVCGHHGHIDSEFFYHYRCSECGAHYAVGDSVPLIPLTAEQVVYVKANLCDFISDDVDHE